MFDFKFIPPKTEQDAWLAGYDSEKNGVNIENCHFSFFSRPELTTAWEKGKKAGKWEKSKIV
jgi:hypothetical protein